MWKLNKKKIRLYKYVFYRVSKKKQINHKFRETMRKKIRFFLSIYGESV